MSLANFFKTHNILPAEEIDKYNSWPKEEKIKFLETMLNFLSDIARNTSINTTTTAIAIAFELGDLTKVPNPEGNKTDGNLEKLLSLINDRGWEAWFPDEVNPVLLRNNTIFCEAVIFNDENDSQDWESTEGRSQKSRYNALAKAYYKAIR